LTGKQILLVDDTDTWRKRAADGLRVAGASVTEEAEFEHVQGLVRDALPRFDAVAIDLKASNGTTPGFETVRAIRRIDQQIPVFVVSYMNSENIREQLAQWLGPGDHGVKIIKKGHLHHVLAGFFRDRPQNVDSGFSASLAGKRILMAEGSAFLRDLAGPLGDARAQVLAWPWKTQFPDELLTAPYDLGAVVVDLDEGVEQVIERLEQMRRQTMAVPYIVASSLPRAKVQQLLDGRFGAQHPGIYVVSKEEGTQGVVTAIAEVLAAGEGVLKDKRVLLVDDKPGMLEAMKWVLEADGVLGTSEQDFNRVMPLLQSQAFDAVVMDMAGEGGGVPGLPVIRRIRSLFPDMPVIIQTVFPSTQVAALLAQALGALDPWIRWSDKSHVRPELAGILRDRALSRTPSSSAPGLAGKKIVVISPDAARRASLGEALGAQKAEVEIRDDLKPVPGYMWFNAYQNNLCLVDVPDPALEPAALDLIRRMRKEAPAMPYMIVSVRSSKELEKLLDDHFGPGHPGIYSVVGERGMAEVLKTAGEVITRTDTALNGQRFLLVDNDERPDRVAALQRRGARVTQELSFSSVMDVVRAAGNNLDGVVMDLRGDGNHMEGWDVIRVLRRERPDVPVFIASDYQPQEIFEQLKQRLGFLDPMVYVINTLFLVQEIAGFMRNRAMAPAVVSLPVVKARPQLIIEPGGEMPSEGLESLSEKARKYLELQRRGLPWPAGFVLRSNRTGELVIDDALRAAWARIKKEGRTVIGRSSHPYEGRRGLPFNGRFMSFENLQYLADADVPPGTVIDPEHPITLESAYRRMVWLARPENTPRVRKYLEDHDIHNFDPLEMDMVVMEEIESIVSAMFNTSDPLDPDVVYVRTNKGNFYYNLARDEIIEEMSADFHRTIAAFARLARRVQAVYGNQQIEAALPEDAASPEDVLLFQTRTFKGLPAESVPKYTRYRTMHRNLRAEGFAYEQARVVVLDDLQAATGYQDLPGYRGAEYRGGWDLKGLENKAKKRYIDDIKASLSGGIPYILVIKDPDSVVEINRNGRGDKKFFLELLSGARAVVLSQRTTAVAHELFDAQEAGGTIVTVPTIEDGFLERFVHRPRHSRDGDMKLEKSGTGNVDLLTGGEVRTGDLVELLVNLKGIFIAPLNDDNPNGVNGADAAMAETPGGIDLNSRHYTLTIQNPSGRATQVILPEAELADFRFDGADFHITSIQSIAEFH
jgi:CheY-like chemotaxis protein